MAGRGGVRAAVGFKCSAPTVRSGCLPMHLSSVPSIERYVGASASQAICNNELECDKAEPEELGDGQGLLSWQGVCAPAFPPESRLATPQVVR